MSSLEFRPFCWKQICCLPSQAGPMGQWCCVLKCRADFCAEPGLCLPEEGAVCQGGLPPTLALLDNCRCSCLPTENKAQYSWDCFWFSPDLSSSFNTPKAAQAGFSFSSHLSLLLLPPLRDLQDVHTLLRQDFFDNASSWLPCPSPHLGDFTDLSIMDIPSSVVVPTIGPGLSSNGALRPGSGQT